MDEIRGRALDAHHQGCQGSAGMKRRVAWTLALAACVLPAASLAQAKTPPDTLEQRLKACSICHGDQGEGLRKNEYYPRLAGKPAGYLYNQLVNFRDKRREFAIMNYMVAYLSDTYLLQIADHYSK